jgi:hypothetical protein
MPYVKSDRPPGRPRKYARRDDEPARLSLRISHELSDQLKATAHEQHTSVAAVVLSTLERGLCTPALDAIDTDLTQALTALADLEQAIGETITPVQDARLRPQFDRVFQLFLALGDTLNGLKGS